MKKLPALLTTLVAANSIFATDLSWNGKFNDSKEYNSNIVRIDKDGVWSPNQKPTAADNIDISYDYNSSSAQKFSSVITGETSITANNMTYNLKNVVFSDYRQWDNFNALLLLGSFANLNLSGNLEINLQKSPSATGYIWTRIDAYGNSTVNVGGDFIVNSDITNYFRFAQEGIQENQAFGLNVQIGGDLINKNNTNFVFSNYSSTVKGVVRLGSGIINLAANVVDIWDPKCIDSVNLSFGGLEGDSSIFITKKFSEDITTNKETYNAAPVYLTFTNSGTSAFKGALLTTDNNTGKLNIRMEGTENSRQILRITSSSTTSFYEAQSYSTKNVSNDGICKVTVDSGRIDIGMFNDKSAGDISLNGGKLSAIGLDSEVGTLAANSLVWGAGTLVVDFSENGADLLQLAGALSILESATLEISASAADLLGWGISEGSKYTIITFDPNSGISQDDINSIKISAQSGIDAELIAILDESNNISGIGLQFVQVPEPSTFAAIFALVAAFAAFRPRKR